MNAVKSVVFSCKIALCFACLTLVNLSFAADTDVSIEPNSGLSEIDRYQRWAENLWHSMRPKNGTISLPNGVATLYVPDNFYYLSPEDAEKVLQEVWGNPPSDKITLGMLFPAHMTPFDKESWGVTIDYVEDGFVKDDDVDNLDYAQMLTDMQRDTRSENKYRLKQGYESITLLGWASVPYYDKVEKKLHWAKEYNFGDQAENTLNYNIRILGRKGYLLLNFIAAVEQLDEIQSNIPTVLQIAEFDQGYRYSDFNPEMDKIAAYGIGALVAGEGFISKSDIITGVTFFLKNSWFVILIMIASIGSLITWRRKFSTSRKF